MADSSPPSRNGIVGRVGRVRGASVNLVRGASSSLINANPQLGMWQATGTAIAQAPNLKELRDAQSGGSNITFNAQGHSSRIAAHARDGELTLYNSNSNTNSRQPAFATPKFDAPIHEDAAIASSPAAARDLDPNAAENPNQQQQQQQQQQQDQDKEQQHPKEKHHNGHNLHLHRRQSLHEKHQAHDKEKWGPTIMNGLRAFWKFFKTPSGFLIIIYGLNIVAWGAMLFFLLLKAAPAMNHPTADDNNSPRKKWLETSSQILNALFCVTAFGLAPWRFRDLYWFIRASNFKDPKAMMRLAEQNKAWFRPPVWATEKSAGASNGTRPSLARSSTFTGHVAPPTPLWKLGFTIWMMVSNTLLQVVLCYFMWGYNRFDRPPWATGTFIGLGCGVGMFAGLMSWWEGRKVKKIEGPQVQIVTEDGKQASKEDVRPESV